MVLNQFIIWTIVAVFMFWGCSSEEYHGNNTVTAGDYSYKLDPVKFSTIDSLQDAFVTLNVHVWRNDGEKLMESQTENGGPYSEFSDKLSKVYFQMKDNFSMGSEELLQLKPVFYQVEARPLPHNSLVFILAFEVEDVNSLMEGSNEVWLNMHDIHFSGQNINFLITQS